MCSFSPLENCERFFFNNSTLMSSPVCVCVEKEWVSVCFLYVCLYKTGHINVHLYCRMPLTVKNCYCHFSISQSDLLPPPASLHSIPNLHLSRRVSRSRISSLCSRPSQHLHIPKYTTDLLPGNSPVFARNTDMQSSTAFRYMGWF